MTWLAWRQLRVPALSVWAGLAAIGVVLAITGPKLVGRTNFTDVDVLFTGTLIAVYALPVVIGVFWGAPMVTRELETGTHNLVWNQSVTRTRWLATKFGVGVPVAVVSAGLLSFAVTWWAAPIDAYAEKENDQLARIMPEVFAARGVAPVGYALFALVLGVAVGIVVRRTVAAMALTLVLFAAVQVAVPLLVRPHLLPATDESVAITASNIRQITGNESGVLESLTVAAPSDAWVLTNETVDAGGTPVHPLPEPVHQCLPKPGSGDAFPERGAIGRCMSRLTELGYRQHLVYLPGSRFWPLQWVELGLFVVLSALSGWFCFRRLRHLS
ncbi:ABC transporter permease subunit [Saccharothrix sp. NPDC042600]|uniref:ABC transporter permease subunit n=1 Tax=Saccharothrix TaxID=2071 RepID=UPI0033E1AAF3|nr:transporter [Saccharothrix mutabilis subsp. capreolus]